MAAHPTADAATAATWEALREETAPAAFTTAVADLLASIIDLSRPVIDVGTGTGHLAAALAERGADGIALDLSVPMLERVPASLPRVAADATCLPVPTAAAGAVLAAHVLHVVPDWRSAVAEADRVAGPRGIVLVQSSPTSTLSDDAARLRAVFRDHLPLRAMLGTEVVEHPSVLVEGFATVGRTPTDLAEVRVARRGTLRGVLRWLEGNLWTWPGPSTDDERAAAAAATVAWATGEGLDLDAPFEMASVNRWRSYEKNPGGPS